MENIYNVIQGLSHQLDYINQYIIFEHLVSRLPSHK